MAHFGPLSVRSFRTCCSRLTEFCSECAMWAKVSLRPWYGVFSSGRSSHLLERLRTSEMTDCIIRLSGDV